MRTTGPRIAAGILCVCASAVLGTSVSAIAQTTAPNEWTWIGGSNVVTNPNGPPGVYGKLGTSAPKNIPGGRDSAATWTDSSGNFWLFGGEGADANGNFGLLDDLWEFQPSTQQWAWMGGSSTVPSSCAGSTTTLCGQPGVYGNLGSAANANNPGGREAAMFWTDSSGNFWLFGGYGFDAGATVGELNDLWEFNTGTKVWAWIAGSATVGSGGGQPGVFGTMGSANAANIPSGRDSATRWVDKNGEFWMYGGEGFDSNGQYGQLEDLWKYDPAGDEWTWMSGSSTLPTGCSINEFNNICGWPAVYGALGVGAPGISPGSRIAGAGWADGEGNLWLFGGEGNVFWETMDFSLIDQYDLWEFKPSTRQWAWMSGNTTDICGESTSEEDWCGEDGIYGAEGVPSIANIPPSRGNANTWQDPSGNLWLFGGAQPETTSTSGANLCNDVWVFEPAANEWAWMNGEVQFGLYSCTFTNATYGTLGAPAAANTPSGRIGAASWTDGSGNLWVFGGYGWNGGNLIDLNDLWIYEPVAPAPAPSFEVVASPNPINVGAIGTGTPTITTATTTVSVITAAGFNAPVTLSAATDTMNGVTDITGSFSPATITGNGSSTLTLSVTGAAVLVTEAIPLTITATGGGITQTTGVSVLVTQVGQTPAPTFSIAAGNYPTTQTVTISDTSLAEYNNTFIYYTTDGSTPTASSPVYVNPITIASTTTLKAIAILIDDYQSAVSSATYAIVPAAATPVFTPGGGTYSAAQAVTLADATPGATIYYTTDGSTPGTGSTVYSGPISVASTETLNAMAAATGYPTSAVATAAYTIHLPVPSFSVTGTAVSVAPGATTGNTSTITLTPAAGFTGTIDLSCAITPAAAHDPATCALPSSATITGAAAKTVMLTVTTTAATTALNQPGEWLRKAAGGAALACVLLLGIPGRRRRAWHTAALLALLLCAAGGALACGNSGGNGGGGGGGQQDSGTTPGTYTITVTGIAGSLTETGMASLTVE